MHGIFPTHNKYYIRTEIFPYLSKKEKKEVYYPTKKSKPTKVPRRINSDEE
jgi:hypothetical protein